MAKGISIHVGVNATTAPGLTLPALGGCVNDAIKMQELAQARGFTGFDGGPPLLITENAAKYDDVLAKISQAAETLNDGDIFLFTFAGHGLQRAGTLFENSENGNDGMDETLVLSDKFVLDNVLRRDLWPTFKPGVRVVMVADSCHSGGVAMVVADHSDDDHPADPEYSSEHQNGADGNVVIGRVRSLTGDQADAHFTALSEFYTHLNSTLPSAANANQIQASVMLLAACKEDEKTRESTINGKTQGVYTRALLDVWGANNNLTYTQLIEGVKAQVQPNTPVLMMIEQSPPFVDTEAFKI